MDACLRQQITDLLKRNAKKEELRQMLAKVAGVDYPVTTKPSDSIPDGYRECVGIFMQEYYNFNHLQYFFSACDGKALKDIIHKLHSLSDSSVVASFEYMIKNLPAWYKEHAYNLTTINSKFNVIISAIKNVKHQYQYTDYEERTARDCFGLR